MGLEGIGIGGILVLIANVYAIVKTLGSNATTGQKVFWIILILLLPILGVIIWFFAGPRG
jgi:hypothetical protein